MMLVRGIEPIEEVGAGNAIKLDQVAHQVFIDDGSLDATDGIFLQDTFGFVVVARDNIIIINAKEVTLTGNKLNNKIYYNHSGYTGGLRERTAKEMRENYPVEMVERAVKGMLPHNRLGRAMYKKLFVYEGSEHPHMAQKPVEMKVK